MGLSTLGLASGTVLASHDAGASVAAIESPWTGRWSRPPAEVGGFAGGVTTFTQNGPRVSGSYNWNGGGTLEATASGSTLGGTWSDSISTGHYTLQLDATGTRFSGTWFADSGSIKGRSGPWSGTRIEEPSRPASARVGFSLEQMGLPTRLRRGLVHSRTTGAGEVLLPLPQPGQTVSRGTAGGSIVHIDRTIVGGRRVTLRIGARLTGATYTSAPTPGAATGVTRVLQLTGTVTSSNDPACPVGRAARFVLRDAGTGDGLNVLLQLCQRTHAGEQYEVSRRDRVKVRISAPVEVVKS